MTAVAALTAAALFALFSLPGWIAAGGGRPLWTYAAAGFVSQAAVVLLFALLAAAVPGGLALVWILPLAAALAAGAWIWRPRTGPPSASPAFEPWSVAVALVATACGAAILHFAIANDGGDLVVRAFFNADGFKHLGLVQGLAAFGAPAQDIFGHGDRLAYYWLFYLIPATGAALYGDAFGALVAAGLLQTFAFWILVYGLVRQAGATPRAAAALAALAWISPSLDGIAALAGHSWSLGAAIADANVEAYNEQLVSASGLFRLGLYIPQHQFMLAGFLSWGLLHAVLAPRENKMLRLLSFAPLVAAAAISTLLGLVCMLAFALTMIADRRIAPARRLLLIGATGLGALAVGLILGVVSLKGGNSGIASPIFADPVQTAGPVVRLLRVVPGAMFAYGIGLLGLIGLWRWWRARDAADDIFRSFVTATVLAGFAAMAMAALVDAPRLVQEAQMRASLLPAIGMAIAAAWLFGPAGSPRRLSPALSLAALPLLAVGLLTFTIDIGWHTASQGRWLVRIPGDDRQLLGWMEGHVAKDAVVLQYPEPPFLSEGRDMWVPLIAGRQVYSSPRATNWVRHAPMVERATRWFARGGPPPPNVTHIYLSRALTSDAFDARRTELEQGSNWQSVKCVGAACLFARQPGTAPRSPPSPNRRAD